MKEKRVVKLFISLFSLFVLTTSGAILPEEKLSASSVSSQPNSQCVQCHTDVRKLIRLSWEVEKVKPKQKKSVQTSGEG